MMRVILCMMLSIILCSCSFNNNDKLIPAQSVEQIASKPPESAMIAPEKSIPLKHGAEDSYNSGVMRINNLSCSNDRAKLIILQEYVRTLFPEDK